MAYQVVKSIAEWQQALRVVQKRSAAMRALIRQVRKAENTAGLSGAINWPIDGLTDELMYSDATGEGPFKDYDAEIDAALAASYRYQYTVKPGRPASYVVGRLTPCFTYMLLHANAGVPFSSVFANAATGDLVQVSWTSPTGEVATYNNIRIDVLDGAGAGIRLNSPQMTHTNNSAFTGSADCWSLGTDWVYAANAINTGGAPTDTNVIQTHDNLVWPFVNGVTYRLNIHITVYNAGSITPKIGSASASALTAAANTFQYITCNDSGANLTLDAVAFDGTVTTVGITPIAWEHVAMGCFYRDQQWTYGGNWQYDVANDWMEDNGAAIAIATRLQQLEANLAIPLVANTTYRVDFEVTRTAGKIRPILGDAVGYYVDDAGPQIYSQYLTPTTNPINLEFESDGNWQGSITNISAFEEVENPNGPIIVKLQQTDE